MPIERPKWLLKALANTSLPEHIEKAPLKIGDIRLATAPDAEPRLVLVTDIFDDAERPKGASIMLISNEVEYAASQDHFLIPSQTRLPYEILVEADLVGPVKQEQLSEERYGALVPEVAPKGLARVFEGKVGSGLPIRPINDSRWDWKEGELRVLHGLCAPYMNEILD